MKPTSKTKKGLFAIALGLTGSFSLISFPAGTAFGQFADPWQSVTAAAAPNPVPQQEADYQAHFAAAQKLHIARKAVAGRDFATAERLTAEVQASNLVYQVNEERPEAVINLIQQYRQLLDYGKTAGNTEQFRRNYAIFSLTQADVMLKRGELDLAKQLTQEAANQRVPFNQADIDAGLEPTTMYKRIDDARRIRDRQVPVAAQLSVPIPQQPLSQATREHLAQAQQLLRQAREALNAGQLVQAEQLGRTAIQYQLPESVYPNGSDTPSLLLADIAARRQGLPINPPFNPTAEQAVYHPAQDQSRFVQTSGAGSPAAAARGAVVDQVVRDRQAYISQISADIMQQIADAQRTSREQRKPEAGLEILQAARTRVEQSQLDSATKEMFVRQLDRAIDDTVKFMEGYSAQSKQEQINQKVWAERRQESEQFRNKEERLDAGTKECNKLIDEGRYEEAVMVAKRMKEFAPDEPATNMLLTATQLAYNSSRSLSIRDEKAEGVVDALLAVDQSSIIPNLEKSPLQYSTNWGDLNKRRRASNEANASRRPESEKQILRKLELPVTLSVNQPIPLEQALQLLCGQAGVPLYFDQAALREADVMTDTMVRVPPANEIRLRSVLKTILEQQGLDYVVKNEMLNITSAKRAKGTMYNQTYYIGELGRKIPQIIRSDSSGFDKAFERSFQMQSKQVLPGARSANYDDNFAANDVQASGNPNILAQSSRSGGGRSSSSSGGMSGGYGGGGGGGSGGYGGGGGGNDMDFGSITDIIESVIAPDSWSDGEASMTEYEAGQSLVIRQTEEVHAEISDLLTQLRKMGDLQVAVEVRYITLSDSFYEKMGMDFDMTFRNDNAVGRIKQTTTTTGTGDDATTVTSTKGDHVTVGLTAPGNFSVDASIPFQQDSFSLAVPPFGSYNPASGFQSGFALLSDIEAYFFLSAAQGDQRSSVLQAPKVMVYNGQYASVQDQSYVPFVTSVTPVVADFAAAYQPIITILSEGQILDVQAVVSADRSHVRLTLNPTFSKITKVNTFKFVGDDEETEESQTTAKGDDTSKASTDERNATRRTSKTSSGVTVQLPTVASFNVSTTVNVPDGGTILLGGIKRLSEGRIESGTPILNKIPYINRLFSNAAIGRDTQSIMMMVTPRIIIQDEEEQAIMGRSMP